MKVTSSTLFRKLMSRLLSKNQLSVSLLFAVMTALGVSFSSCMLRDKDNAETSETGDDRRDDLAYAEEDNYDRLKYRLPGQAKYDDPNQYGDLRPDYDTVTVTEAPAAPAPADDLVREARKVGGDGDLKLTLLWNFPGDIDIHVLQPNGKEIYYRYKKDNSTGGFLDVDNVVGGSGSAENVFWKRPPKGTYKVWLHYFQPSRETGETGAGLCNVVLLRKGQDPKTYKVRMSEVGQRADVVTFTVD